MHPVVLSVAKGTTVLAVWFAAILIDESTLIPIGSAVAVLLGVWHLSARFQKMEDGIKELNRRIKVLEDR